MSLMKMAATVAPQIKDALFITLRVQKQPSANGGPVQVIVGETSPPSQHANRNIGRDGTHRPDNWISVHRFLINDFMP